MKKSIYLTVCFILSTASFFTSCSKKAEIKPVNVNPITVEENGIIYEVNPVGDVMMEACRLAGVRAFRDDSSSSYVEMMDKMYEPLKNHPLVKQLKKASSKFQGNAFYELEIINYISPDMTSLSVTKDTMPGHLKEFWGKVNLDDFIHNFNDFAVKGNFERIWKMNEGRFKGNISAAMDFHSKKPSVLSFYKDYFYGPDDDVKIIIYSSPFTGGYDISLPVYEENNQKIVKFFQSTFTGAASDYDDFYVYKNFVRNEVFTEIDKNWDKIGDKAIQLYNEICKANKISTKKTDISGYKYNVTEVLSAAIASKYAFANKEEILAEEIDKAQKKYIIFTDFEKIDGLLKQYDDNRTEYPDFSAFFSSCFIQAFNEAF